jgi:CRISPR-associated protein Cas5d
MNLDKNRVGLRVWGDLACFTRPEMKVERVSYEVMTPSAARGILEAIYWKPQISWIVDRIHVLRPLKFTNVRRNELGNVGPSVWTLRPYLRGQKTEALGQVVEMDRQQRASLILQDVEYLIEAHFMVRSGEDPSQKHYEMFKRRASKGQCFHRPYLGCREFAAAFEWHDGEPPTPPPCFEGTRDLGFMLHDIDFEVDMVPRFFHATLVNGMVTIPPLESGEIRS